jgi:hypothetical protein
MIGTIINNIWFSLLFLAVNKKFNTILSNIKAIKTFQNEYKWYFYYLSIYLEYNIIGIIHIYELLVDEMRIFSLRNSNFIKMIVYFFSLNLWNIICEVAPFEIIKFIIHYRTYFKTIWWRNSSVWANFNIIWRFSCLKDSDWY